ncbi:MAG: response regulator [Nitrospiraceae bacterium]|nr:response regulator [Nitrospiraceae bacterium]
MKKILIVDDLKPFIEQQKNILCRSDFQILTATSGIDALEIHKELGADLMIIDLDMPGMSGDELCSEIRKNSNLKSVSILMVTRPNEKDIERCKKCGANDYITKPIKAQSLVEKATILLVVSERKNFRALAKIKIEGMSNSFNFSAFSVNLSSTGILIETELSLPISDVISCSFFLPDKTSVSFKGEVARVMKKNGAGMYQYGIRFTNISNLNKLAIEEYIKTHHTSSDK